MKKLSILIGAMMLILFVVGCSNTAASSEGDISIEDTEITQSRLNEESSMPESEKESENNMIETEKAPKLVYFGHASICIITEDDKVIYVDPYEEGDYSLAADLVLVTHDHFDHNQIDKIENKNDDCKIITQDDALVNGEYMTFELPFVTAEAVEAGNNPNHDINSCVGYVLTFKNGKSVYISGDTSTTDQMDKLHDKNIDYAFFCCDGVFNMDNEEAAMCAETVGAKHNIPYHNETANGKLLDKEKADSWSAPNKIIIMPGESINIE
ncbi:MAG: MBL fold metallo-hydrolase [Clostridia bacterium]|nr:MBL fold metallo-hydrolase [Clostridia bacterium]